MPPSPLTRNKRPSGVLGAGSLGAGSLGTGSLGGGVFGGGVLGTGALGGGAAAAVGPLLEESPQPQSSAFKNSRPIRLAHFRTPIDPKSILPPSPWPSNSLNTIASGNWWVIRILLSDHYSVVTV